MSSFKKILGFFLYLLATSCVFVAYANASLQSNRVDIDWIFPIQRISNQPLRITKYSGPKVGLSLEVDVMQKVLVPSDGTLLYKGTIESTNTGIVILHSDNLVSVISAPQSWESSADYLPGSFLKKGQEIAVVRNGRIGIMQGVQITQSLRWNLYKIKDSKLISDLELLLIDVGKDKFNIENGIYSRLKGQSEINIKEFFGMGSFQFEVHAKNSDGCSIIVFSKKFPCADAEENDFLVSAGIFKFTVETGNFFKSRFEESNYVSSPETVIQSIIKVDAGKFAPGSYEIKLSESAKLPEIPTTGEAIKLAEAVAAERFGKPLPAVSSDSTAVTRETSQAKDLAQIKQQTEQKEQQRLALEEQQKESLRQAELVKAKESEQAIRMKELEAIAETAKAKDLEMQKLKEQLTLAQNQMAVASQPVASAERKMRKALILGNDSYKDVPVLLNARSDAKAVSASLARSGFEIFMHLDLTERGMKEAIRNFKSQIKGGDEVVMYFAGHGVQLGATNYLLPVDIRGQSEDQVRDEAIPLQRMLDDIQDTKARFALAIIDACRDNPFKTAGRNIGGRGLGVTSAATGQMVMFSAGTGQQALDRLGPNDKEPNGLFTRVLLKEMDKPGVSIERLVRNVRNEVARLSKSVGHDQVPAVYDQTLGDFYFRPQ